MKTIRKEGKSEFELVTNFKKERSLKNEDFTYEIEQKGSNGFLNIFGNKPTIINFKIKDETNSKKVEATKSTKPTKSTKSNKRPKRKKSYKVKTRHYQEKEIGKEIEVILTEILDKIKVKYEKIELDETNEEVLLHIIGAEDGGFLIGKEGRFLNSLQHLLNRMKKFNQLKKIKLDVDGYNARRENAIIRKAKGACKKVERTGKSVTLESMKSSQRKLVHRFIENQDKFRTITVGNGYMKRVVILPIEQEK
ncbi:MAG: KH domain-containing protein [Candidatus Cloacimonadota bacterium]|nr:KH domain-containing protein [Candidatus Cloacimonadota bacterium]